jgi:hypothetical protein
MDGPGPVVVGGMLYVNSGYPRGSEDVHWRLQRRSQHSVDEKGAPPILATRPINANLVTRRIRIVAAALAIIIVRSGSGCASRRAIICASMNSPVNPSNAHRRKRATYSGVGFVKGQGHHFLLVTNETRAEPLRTAALR